MKHRISQVDGNNSESDECNSRSEDNSEIDKDCFKRFGNDKADAIDEDFFKACRHWRPAMLECHSCDNIFKTAEECYIHMLLSTSRCCQKTISNLKENGHAQDLDKLGIQKGLMKSCYQNPSSDG